MDNVRTMILRVIFMITMIFNNLHQSNELRSFNNADNYNHNNQMNQKNHSSDNGFGVLPKYPNELQITENDAKTAIRFAEEIKDFVVNIVQTL